MAIDTTYLDSDTDSIMLARPALLAMANKANESVSVKDFIPPGTNTTSTDCAPYFQAAIDYCMKQYDPTETTHDGNSTTYMWQQRTLWIPAGRYSIGSTLNVSFRNHIEMVGESQFGTQLWWTGAIDGMVIDARCSNYVKFRNFTIDGNHQALTFIYCAGNGVNAPSSFRAWIPSWRRVRIGFSASIAIAMTRWR